MGKDNCILKVADLTKIYGKTGARGLDGVGLTVDRGDIFGLLGPNGAGKTTTISIMSTVMKPTSGTVSICGIDALRHPGRVRPLIGFVPQEIALYPTLTAEENLIYFGRLHGLKADALSKAVAGSLDFVGLGARGRERVDTFSGGMKRRVNLAVGILNRPKLLFLDEPTVGIDPQSRNLIIEKLHELSKGGMSMVYTTHHMEEAEKLCTDVAIIDAGRIIACGRPEELIADANGPRDLGALFLDLTGKELRD